MVTVVMLTVIVLNVVILIVVAPNFSLYELDMEKTNRLGIDIKIEIKLTKHV